ncbi:E3 ubiquitin-protein ligase TRIM39-like [Pholidichthys leucotaenia]
MSSARKHQSEDQFLCSICLDVFTNPVTTPCGHNFCKNCIDQHWNQSVLYKCPICNENFGTKPQLKINRLLFEITSEFTLEAEKKSSSEQQVAKPGEVPCDSCTGIKLKAMKSCLVCLVSYCETHLEPHLTMKGLKIHQLIDPVENLEDRMCSKHHKPLDLFCKIDQTCVCLHCTYSDHRYHDVAPLTEECEGKKADLEKTEAEIHQMIRKIQLNIEEIKKSVKKSKEVADRERAEGVQVFTALKESVESHLNELIKEIENKQKTTEKQAEDSIKALEQEISELIKRSCEVEQLLKSEDHLHLLQSFSSLKAAPPTKDWTEVRVHPPSYDESVVTALDQLEKTFRKQVKKFELKWVQRYEVDVTLDPDTAHPRLTVSDDGKQVFDGNVEQDVPDDQERFTYLVSVLGKQSFSSGRFYFEVQVKGKTEWALGVVRESINKYGNIRMRPDTGFWTLCLINGNEYGVSEDLPVFFPCSVCPEKVGVFVDYEGGLILFYDVDAPALIYCFRDCPFNEKIYPYFSLWYNDDAKTSEPLIITPVSQTD